MARALQLAERGLYTTTPNPRVGCVIVREGVVVGEGWHERAGEPHAEIHALRAAGDKARGQRRMSRWSHAAITDARRRAPTRSLQPVSAAWWQRCKTPIRRSRAAGFARLRAAQIEVACGLLEQEARELNIGFVSRMQRGRPWVRVKTAASLDGRTALANNVSQWITGPEARRDGHRWRARSCAVMIGIGTLKADDPRLTVRDVETTRQPVRIVVDRNLELPLAARILEGGNALVATAREDREKARLLARRRRRSRGAAQCRGQGRPPGTDAGARSSRDERDPGGVGQSAERRVAARAAGGRVRALSRPAVCSATRRAGCSTCRR